MIEINLLPDVKLEYLRAARSRRLVITVSTLVTLAAIGVLVLLYGVTLLQQKHLSDLNKDIKSESSKIEGHSDLNKILTVQNQLESLTSLHASKPAVSRLSTYLGQITPAKANISNLSVDFGQHTMTLTGTADLLATVNQYVDTLKFTSYTSTSTSNGKPAFSNVVLSSFAAGAKEVDYTITLTYDPAIFDITQGINLTVPKEVTTRSEVDKPSDLFEVAPTPVTTGGKH